MKHLNNEELGDLVLSLENIIKNPSEYSEGKEFIL